MPWLRLHNPHISWKEEQWDPTCFGQCLKRINPLPVHTTLLKETTFDIPDIPQEYYDLLDVFSKAKASQLPPHRSSDCAIPGSTPPRGRIFPLSQPESEAMRNYIEEELAKGFIRPSTSPESAGFFFVKKKDGGLRPCIERYNRQIPISSATGSCIPRTAPTGQVFH